MNEKQKQCTGFIGMALLATTLLGPGARAQHPSEALRLDERGVPIGCDLIEGDIIYCGNPADRGTYATNLWPNGLVQYTFDANLTALNQQRTIDAMEEWEAVANITFVPYDPGTYGYNRIRIRDSSQDEHPGNSSAVGMVTGEQVINIVSWDWHFIIVHEFGHALGYWHEQSRPDRENYVFIEEDRIIDGKGGNFDMHPGAGTIGPYDFESIMHYGQCAFSCCGADPEVQCTTWSCGSDLENCRTITVLSPYTYRQNQIGNRSYMSFWDAKVMAFLYPWDDWYYVGSDGVMLGTGTWDDPWVWLHMAYSTWAPEGSTIWIKEPGDWVIGTTTLDRPMTIGVVDGTVTLVP